MWHLGSHSSHVVEHSGYGWHWPPVGPCEHHPQPSSSVQPHTLLTSAQVLMHLRRHDLRHVLCVDGHSRHVVVHSLAGAHFSLEEHQPQPGARSEQVHTSVAWEQTAGELTLKWPAAATGWSSADARSTTLRMPPARGQHRMAGQLDLDFGDLLLLTWLHPPGMARGRGPRGRLARDQCIPAWTLLTGGLGKAMILSI